MFHVYTSFYNDMKYTWYILIVVFGCDFHLLLPEDQLWWRGKLVFIITLIILSTPNNPQISRNDGKHTGLNSPVLLTLFVFCWIPFIPAGSSKNNRQKVRISKIMILYASPVLTQQLQVLYGSNSYCSCAQQLPEMRAYYLRSFILNLFEFSRYAPIKFYHKKSTKSNNCTSLQWDLYIYELWSWHFS